MSTKRTTISHLISLEIQILAWDIHKIVAGLNPVNGIPTLSFLIIGSTIQYSYGREKNNEYPVHIRGGSRGGGVHPLKLEKNWFFGVKSWFFTRNTPKIFAPPSARRNFFRCELEILDPPLLIPIQSIHIFFIDNVNMDSTITEWSKYMKKKMKWIKDISICHLCDFIVVRC